MSNSQSMFVKQVLLEEGKYERLRQQQFGQNSPELRVMVKLQDQIVRALMDKNLDAQQKLDFISSMQQRFTKLKEETKSLSKDCRKECYGPGCSESRSGQTEFNESGTDKETRNR